MNEVATAAVELARALPDLRLSELALAASTDGDASAVALKRALGLTNTQASLVAGYLREATRAVGLPGALIALDTALTMAQEAGPEPVEVVWTGPAVPGLHARQTSIAIVDLVSSATSEVVIAGYSFSPGARDLVDRLVALAHGGIRVWIIADEPRQLAAFSPAIRGRIQVSTLANDEERRSSLHAKVTVVDRKRMLLTSANFTERGLRSNFELGLLVSGDSAAAVVGLLEYLESSGSLVRVAL